MNQRNADYPIEKFILDRWSPRAMSGAPITQQELMRLFEAARWAPSSYNGQPWRFIYAHRDTEHWQKIFNLLVSFNQMWCKNAAVLVVVASRETFAWNNKPARTHSFDTGAAWENIALQGSCMGLVVHGMEGFDYDRAKTELQILDGYKVEAMFAIGKPGKLADLPKELQEREELSERNPVSMFVCEGVFKEQK